MSCFVMGALRRRSGYLQKFPVILLMGDGEERHNIGAIKPYYDSPVELAIQSKFG